MEAAASCEAASVRTAQPADGGRCKRHAASVACRRIPADCTLQTAHWAEHTPGSSGAVSSPSARAASAERHALFVCSTAVRPPLACCARACLPPRKRARVWRLLVVSASRPREAGAARSSRASPARSRLAGRKRRGRRPPASLSHARRAAASAGREQQAPKLARSSDPRKGSHTRAEAANKSERPRRHDARQPLDAR